MLELLLWTLLAWVLAFAACAYLRDTLGRRWKRVAALGVIPSFLVALVLVFVTPPIGGYDPIAARFWISRAASEGDFAAKQEHVRRVVLASPEHGWYTASEAIASVDDAVQRCRLRTILAGIPGIRNRERLGREARDECNATLVKSAG